MDTASFHPAGRCKATASVRLHDAACGIERAPANPFVRRIDVLIGRSGKTQRQIALELGYDKPNIITMFKQGTTRVPPDKVSLLAISLEADPVELFRLWYETYEPHMVPIIERHFGDFLSTREKQLIKVVRRRFPEGIPNLDPIQPTEDDGH